MKGKSILPLAAIAVLIVASGAAQAEITLRYAHVGVEGAPQTRYATEVARLVEERNDGRVKIQVFPNSQLGNISEMVDGTKMGTIDIAHHDFASLGKILPEMSVFNAPYIYDDAAQAVQATQPASSEVLQELNAKLVDKAGLRVVGSFYRGARQLSANFAVYPPDDVKGKKIPDADREIMKGVFAEMATTSLQWAQEADADIKDKLRAAGVTIIEEKDGLDVNAFRKVVLEQINKDFPEWSGYIKRIQAIK
jgi:TRAP-type C4-dicarboxylate transport system substrate-binding protein